MQHGRQRGGTDAAAGQEDAVASTADAHHLDLSIISASDQLDQNRPPNVRGKCNSTPSQRSPAAQRKDCTHKTPSGGLPAQALPDLPERLSAPTVVELAHERLPERAIRALSAMTELQQRAFQYGREQWSDAGRTDGSSGQVTTLRQRVEQLQGHVNDLAAVYAKIVKDYRQIANASARLSKR